MNLCIFVILCGVIALGSAAECPPTSDKIVACYYASWANYRPTIGQYNTTNIDVSLCTHLVYTFAGLDLNSKIISLDPANDITVNGFYYAATSLKEKNPCMKILLAIGGWNEGSRKYSVTSATPELRETFANSVLMFLAAYGFDGLDLDWEYPTQRGGIPEDKDNLIELLKVLRPKLNKWNLMLTIAVPLSVDLVTSAYDPVQIGTYVDYVFLMAYDYTATTSETTGLLAPLTPIKAAVEAWLAGLNPKQLVLGFPCYARSFTLADNTTTGIGAPTNGSGTPGQYTQQSGFLSYYELQMKLLSGRYTVSLEDDTQYAFYGNDWLSYDSKDNQIKKVQYAVEKDLGGVMAWSIDTDDFRGLFSSIRYPVLSTLNEELYKS